ncbi:S8 family serine peptidase [Reichenbachiella sp. MALMAid0571]|uniref:S8 family serine peptidase n=1 Tax=Reichenbachiella sp. MALMAid0571 TaxID=3143939 RepID=UPI0032DF9ED0
MIKNQSTIKLVFLLLLLVSCEQKRKYWIYFDRINCENSEWLDLTCQDRLATYDIDLDYFSGWLNAGTALLTNSQVKALSHLTFVGEIQPVMELNFAPMAFHEEKMGLSFALEQIEGEFFVDKELTGKGVKIGIIDGGFLEANKKEGLAHIFKNNLVKAYKDFITPELKEYGGSKYADDGHGTEVWEQISGVNAERNVRFGLATEADFYLARTDDGRKEYRQEEEYLIQALEWMEKQEVKLVNISLGYSNGFDNPKENYLPKQIDGKFSAITRAAGIASEEKGMLLVVSAGNDGNNDFKVLSTPADAKGVITVGATNFRTWNKAIYSSIGPEKLGYMKPNVSCFASNGTSFSAPVITGLSACIMQMDSTLTNFDILSIIEQSAHLYPFGNNFIGYGVPSCEKAFELVKSHKHKNVSEKDKQFVVSQKNKIELKIPESFKELVLYHKSDSVNVLFQEKATCKDSIVSLVKPKGAKFTTVAAKDFVREVSWE